MGRSRAGSVIGPGRQEAGDGKRWSYRQEGGGVTQISQEKKGTSRREGAGGATQNTRHTFFEALPAQRSAARLCTDRRSTPVPT